MAHTTGKAEYVSVRETAERFGLSSKTVYNHVEAGDIPHKRVGRSILIPTDYIGKTQGGVHVDPALPAESSE